MCSSDLPVLRDISLTVRRGAIVAVVGANGAGSAASSVADKAECSRDCDKKVRRFMTNSEKNESAAWADNATAAKAKSPLPHGLTGRGAINTVAAARQAARPAQISERATGSKSARLNAG